MVYNIAFDIDQTMAFHKINSPEQGNFILKEGTILSSEQLNTHYIYPGIIELVKRLFCSEEFRVSFFSKGTEDRNLEFVRHFLDLAIEESEFELKKSSVRVLSRGDLSEEECERCRERHYKKYGLWVGYSPKDISKVLVGDEKIEDAVLIDDKSENAMVDQVSNLLLMPLVESDDFDSMLRKKEFYNTDGERYLKCMINFTNDFTIEQELVEDGRRIMLYKMDDTFGIRFIDVDGALQTKRIDKNSALFAKLNDYYTQQIIADSDLADIEDQELNQEVCEFVAGFNGRSKKICRRANRVCYIAGLLFSAISKAKELEISLSEALFQYQFTLKDDKKTYTPNYYKLVKQDRFYWLGLEKLKEVNPDFKFVTPHIYHAYMQKPISEESSSFLKYAKDNEFK